MLDNVGQRYVDFVYQALRGPDSTVSGILVAGVDVTARHEAEAELRASEERAAFVRRSSGVGFWYCDLPFAVLEWDELVKSHFHLPADAEVTIEKFYECIHPDDRESTRRAIERSIAGHTAYNVEYRTVSAETGAVKWVRAIGRTFYAPDGTPTRFDGVTLDISEHKRAEQEREELLYQLREADRQKDEFLATLAHELRNPLAPIRNGLQIMKLYDGTREETERLREMMERQVVQMSHLIDDLMDLSRISRGKISLQKTVLNIADSVRDAIDISRPLIDSQAHQLTIDLPSDAIYVTADPTRLAQVISNILNNAAKYTDRGGTIRLAVHREDHEVVLMIEDNGIGIPEAMLSKIFEMFTQVDRSLEKSQGGLGIGLSIVSRLVSMHEGSIVAESAGQGLGSRFIVRLPITEGVAVASSPQDGIASKDVMRRRVLVVDDNVDGARSLATMLQCMGNEVQTAHDGLQALTVAEAFRPNVILMDIGMPNLNGYDACRRIREKAWGKNIVMIAQTGWGNDDDREKAYAAGFNHHMVKPIEPASLQRIVEELDLRETASGNLKVLAVDDRRDAIYVMDKLLTVTGCDVRTATNGLSALEIVKEFRPNAVFLDIEMPGMNGIEVAKRIRQDESLKNVILIAMTGHDSEQDKQRFVEAGFDTHLTKPADIRNIKQVLITHCGATFI